MLITVMCSGTENTLNCASNLVHARIRLFVWCAEEIGTRHR